ncbi:acetyltransferase [bacterium SCSIO 12827]|nr:acetyltransferase [bacterium SCSIO 12827]
MTRPLIIIGAGGHAAVVLDAARSAGMPVLGLADADPARRDTLVLGAPVIGDDVDVLKHAPADILLIIGIGSTGSTDRRRAAYTAFRNKGYTFATVVHPTATVAAEIELGAGTVVMAGAIIQPRAKVGDNVIINTGARVDHDSKIGAHAHIAPGAVLSGNVTVGDGAHVGVGTTILQGIDIGAQAICAAGAVVIRNVTDGATVAGNPAQEIG